jgi:transposase
MAKKTLRVRRAFTPQFKKDAVALVLSRACRVARDLGIARSLLQRWKEQLDRWPSGGLPGNNLTSQAEEVRRLQKQLRDVTEERDILKKALAYFADDQT